MSCQGLERLTLSSRNDPCSDQELRDWVMAIAVGGVARWLAAGGLEACGEAEVLVPQDAVKVTLHQARLEWLLGAHRVRFVTDLLAVGVENLAAWPHEPLLIHTVRENERP